MSDFRLMVNEWVILVNHLYLFLMLRGRGHHHQKIFTDITFVGYIFRKKCCLSWTRKWKKFIEIVLGTMKQISGNSMIPLNTFLLNLGAKCDTFTNNAAPDCKFFTSEIFFTFDWCTTSHYTALRRITSSYQLKNMPRIPCS